MPKISIFWFRRDLRTHDNAGLFNALRSFSQTLPIFIFDPQILSPLKKIDPRVEFIHNKVSELYHFFRKNDSRLLVEFEEPLAVFKKLTDFYDIDAVYTNTDYEPYAKQRDNQIKFFLNGKNIKFLQFKDQVIFHENDVLKNDGSPYTVYTPYKNKWKSLFQHQLVDEFPSQDLMSNLVRMSAPPKMISLKQLGFDKTDKTFSNPDINFDIIENYDKTRDIPAIDGTSKLSMHLRFGTVSIRELVKIALETNDTWLNELIWREFFMMILYHFPHVEIGPFREKYKKIQWLDDKESFELWCNGQTGFPIVDAGMRELNETGFMHNRVRMIVANFLSKHLLINWQWGEAYFAEKLLDFELSSNNGNWQWSAGCGCDAAPYFRVFNPILQQQKFDPNFEYIKNWVPEFGTQNYPKPMVDLKVSRERALLVYKNGINQN